jgi:hypothetical protein
MADIPDAVQQRTGGVIKCFAECGAIDVHDGVDRQIYAQ